MLIYFLELNDIKTKRLQNGLHIDAENDFQAWRPDIINTKEKNVPSKTL